MGPSLDFVLCSVIHHSQDIILHQFVKSDWQRQLFMKQPELRPSNNNIFILHNF